MRSKPKNLSLCLLLVCIIAVITLASWSMPLAPGMFGKMFSISDTIPKSCNKKLAEMDELYAELDKAKAKLKEQDIAGEIARALREINIQEIQSDVDEALEDANIALADIDAADLKMKVGIALSNINTEKISKQLKIAADNLKPEIERSMEEARLQIEKAQEEIADAKKQLRKKR